LENEKFTVWLKNKTWTNPRFRNPEHIFKFLTPLKPSAEKSMKLQGSSKNTPRNINILFGQVRL